MTRKEVHRLIDGLLESPIAYHRIFATIFGSATAGLLLSQMWYWTKKLYCSRALEEGAEIMSVKELLGHSTLAASERYAQLSNQRVKNVYLQTMQKVIEKTRV